jgi:hypothetical protein
MPILCAETHCSGALGSGTTRPECHVVSVRSPLVAFFCLWVLVDRDDVGVEAAAARPPATHAMPSPAGPSEYYIPFHQIAAHTYHRPAHAVHRVQDDKIKDRRPLLLGLSHMIAV